MPEVECPDCCGVGLEALGSVFINSKCERCDGEGVIHKCEFKLIRREKGNELYRCPECGTEEIEFYGDED